jgi:ABC-type dipeptide/oligopeptide/nickel transport system ATPase subunit
VVILLMGASGSGKTTVGKLRVGAGPFSKSARRGAPSVISRQRSKTPKLAIGLATRRYQVHSVVLDPTPLSNQPNRVIGRGQTEPE